ncbi:MAG: hypothetical protein WCH21_04085 [Bacteroidota bacterium]
MKTTNFKVLAVLLGLALLKSQSMNAGVADKFQKFAGDQISNFSMRGLLVIGGIIGASLLVYIISNHLIEDKEDHKFGQNTQSRRQNHQRNHHSRNIAKKTS